MSSQTESEVPAEPTHPILKSVLAFLVLCVTARVTIAWLSLHALQLQLRSGAIFWDQLFCTAWEGQSKYIVAEEKGVLCLYLFIPLLALKYTRKRKAGLGCRPSWQWPHSREGQPQEPGLCFCSERHSGELPLMFRLSSDKFWWVPRPPEETQVAIENTKSWLSYEEFMIECTFCGILG